MSVSGDDPARSGLLRYYRTFHRSDSVPNELLARGDTARVLAASKPGGVLLNVEAPELTFFIADGMAITSQLVNVTNDPNVHAALTQSMDDDIRVSVHIQHPLEFLDDVEGHRFDLMIFNELNPPAARLAAARLAPGGLLAVFPDAGSAEAGKLERTLADCGLVTMRGTGGALIAARAPDHHQAMRRGGRRKRPPIRG